MLIPYKLKIKKKTHSLINYQIEYFKHSSRNYQFIK
jgi:hypothetical protein